MGLLDFPDGSAGEEFACKAKDPGNGVWSLGREDPLEKEMAPAPVFLPEKWTEEPDGLQSMGLQRIRHDWATKHASNGLTSRLDKTEKNLSLRTSQDKLPKLKAKGTKTEKQNSESKDWGTTTKAVT